MTLRVEFDQFSETVKRLVSSNQAYVAANGHTTVASAADPRSGVLLMSIFDGPAEDATARLREQGLEVFGGSWSLNGAEPANGISPATLFVAAVAYASEETKPGVWVDTYAEEPTLAQVMRAMYDEFVADGEVPGDVSLEEFIRLANPNVVILSPEQLAGFAERKGEGC